ncbi:MAG: Nif3-like dinuclear metal center hexameric protein [Ruminococcus sp.]|nr:Nif3-like dinuclear metal center hexameric protein [Ruminococcus sp.]
MNTIKEILDFTETFAPLNSAMDFDNSGLLVGDENTSVSKVIVCLDITKQVVKEAKEKNAQLIISHHPVIFNRLKHLSQNDIPYMLIQNNLSALCLHTNLDLSTEFGVNTCLANALELENIQYFMDKDKEICLGLGELESPLSEFDFANLVKEKLNCKGLRYTELNKTIKKVAVSSGAGGSEINFAKSKGADVLVTGEIKHNQILDANNMELSIVDAGHFKTENVVVLPLVKKLSKKFSETVFEVSDTCSDFINYL